MEGEDDDQIEADQPNEPNEPDEGEQPDPRDAEIERLRAREQQLLDHAFQQQRPAENAPAPGALRNVEPDFSDADDIGLSPSHAKYVYGKLMATVAAREDNLRREFSGPRPKSINEIVASLKKKAGRDDIDDDTTEGIARRITRELQAEGITEDRIIEGRIVGELKQRAAPAVVDKKGGTYAGPSGTYSGVRRAKTAEKDPEVKTLVQVIKEDRRKRGLSYY